MISLAGRDILHAWGKFVFTGIGLGLLIGVTLVMAGVYRSLGPNRSSGDRGLPARPTRGRATVAAPRASAPTFKGDP